LAGGRDLRRRRLVAITPVTAF